MNPRITLLAAAMAATISLGACSREDAPPQPRVSDATPPVAAPAPSAPSTPAQPTTETAVNPAAKAEARQSPPPTVPAPDDDQTMRTGKPSQEVVPAGRDKESIKGNKAFEG